MPKKERDFTANVIIEGLLLILVLCHHTFKSILLQKLSPPADFYSCFVLYGRMLSETEPDFCADLASIVHNESVLKRSLQSTDDDIRSLTVDFIQQTVYSRLIQ